MLNITRMKSVMLAGVAVPALLLAGCGGEEETSSAGSTVSDAAESAMVDLTSGSPIDKPFRYANASESDLQCLDTLIASADAQPFQIGETSFDPDLGAVVLNDISNTEDGQVFTVERAELYGVNCDYLEAMRDGVATDGPAEVFRKVRLFNISLTGYEEMEFDGEMSVEAMELDRLQLPALTADGEEPVPAPAGEGFALSGLFLKNATFNALAEDIQTIDFAVADMRMSDLERGSIGPVLMKQMEYTIVQDPEAVVEQLGDGENPLAGLQDSAFQNLFFPEEQRIVIENGKWDGLNASGLMTYLINEETPPVDATDLISIGQFEASDMTAFVNGKQASYTEYSVMEPIEFAWLIPENITVRTRGSVADMTAYIEESETELLAIMQEYGMDEMPSAGEFKFTYEPEAGAIDFLYDVDMRGFADIDMTFGTSGLTLEQFDQAINQENPMALATVAIDDFNFTIDDETLLEAIIAVSAHETEQTPEELRASLPAMLALGSSQASGMIPEVETYVAELSAFIESGGKIEIAMTPENPVPVFNLIMLSQASPQMIPSMLALSVEHTE